MQYEFKIDLKQDEFDGFVKNHDFVIVTKTVLNYKCGCLF